MLVFFRWGFHYAAQTSLKLLDLISLASGSWITGTIQPQATVPVLVYLCILSSLCDILSKHPMTYLSLRNTFSYKILYQSLQMFLLHFTGGRIYMLQHILGSTFGSLWYSICFLSIGSLLKACAACLHDWEWRLHMSLCRDSSTNFRITLLHQCPHLKQWYQARPGL